MEGERGSERPNERYGGDRHAKLNLRVGSDGSPKPLKKSDFAGQTNRLTDLQTNLQTYKLTDRHHINFLQPPVAKREVFQIFFLSREV